MVWNGVVLLIGEFINEEGRQFQFYLLNDEPLIGYERKALLLKSKLLPG